MSIQSNTSTINSSIIFDDSMLDPITFGPMTTLGLPDETGRPMSCVQTGYTVGETTLHQLDQHPITRGPIIMAQWKPNFALIACIEQFMVRHITPSNPVSPHLPLDESAPIQVIFIDTSGSMRLCVDKTPVGESGIREITRLDEVQWLLQLWIKWLYANKPSTLIAVISFNNLATLLGNRVFKLDTLESSNLLCAEIKRLVPGGGTQLLGAMQSSLAKIASMYPNPLEITIKTDGEFDSIMFGIETAYRNLCKQFKINRLTFFAIGEGINVDQINKLSVIQNSFHENSSRVLGLYGSKFAATIAGTYIITSDTPRVLLSPICLTLLTQAVCFLSTQVKYPVNTGESGKKALSKFVEFVSTKKGQSLESDKLIAALCYELEGGEIFQAFQPSNFKNWGQLYVLSIIESYKNKYPLNAGPMDSLFYTEVDEENLSKFQQLLMEHGNIVPTGDIITRYVDTYQSQSYSQSQSQSYDTATLRTASSFVVSSSGQVNVVSTYDSDPGCFGPDTVLPLLSMNITVKDLKPGTVVFTSDRQLVAIRKLIDTIGTLDLYQLSPTVFMSQYHPVDMPDKGWNFPCDISTKKVKASHRYSIVLEPLDINGNLHNGTILLDSGISAITLGHGRKDGILDHPFFANIDRVTETYSHLPGWTEGLIQVYSKDAIVTRDETNSVTMIRYPAN